jgi:molybdopterin-guanine dinucleotide biosynthesis protein A
MADLGALSSRTGGLLLAGGRSSRFGAEKAVARFGGAPMMDAVAQCFDALPRVAVSARPESAAAAHARAIGADVVLDRAGAPSGPLAGVHAGMHWARRRGFTLLATAPCDAPRLPRDMFAHLLAALSDAPAAFAATAQGDYPLCAVWRCDLAAHLQSALADGRHPAVRVLLAGLGAVRVPFAEELAFANANTPAALAALERPA